MPGEGLSVHFLAVLGLQPRALLVGKCPTTDLESQLDLSVCTAAASLRHGNSRGQQTPREVSVPTSPSNP